VHGNDIGSCEEEILYNIAVISLMQCRMEMAMKVCPVVCNNIIAVTEVVLQNCLDSQKDEPRAHSEACPSSSPDGVQAVNIKVEEFSDVEDREDPVPVTVVGIRAEHEVSCMSVFTIRPILHIELPILFLNCICHAKLLQCFE
jgi:hypothetical protein